MHLFKISRIQVLETVRSVRLYVALAFPESEGGSGTVAAPLKLYTWDPSPPTYFWPRQKTGAGHKRGRDVTCTILDYVFVAPALTGTRMVDSNRLTAAG